MQHYYFDTSILIGCINPKEGRDSSERAKNIIRASLKALKRNSQIKIIIPTVVLGEIIQQLNEMLENSEWMDALGKPILDDSKKFYSFDSMFIVSKIISELKDEYNSKFEIES